MLRRVAVPCLLVLCILPGGVACGETEQQWTYRLGFRGAMVDSGLKVVHIEPGSPVLKMQGIGDMAVLGVMDVEDIVTEVDGQPVRSLEDYYRWMDASVSRGGAIELSVRDVNSSLIKQWRVQARRIRRSSQVRPQRVAHFLLIGDTEDPKVGTAQESNLTAWHNLAKSVRAERRGTLRVIKGAKCKPADILAAVRRLDVRARDTIFCFYGGHGAHDPNRAEGHRSGGHFLSMGSPGIRSDLMRRTLSNALEAKGVRLVVLITDTCNIEHPALPAEAVYDDLRTADVYGLSAYEKLLLDHQGIVDISGTDFGEFGYCEPALGGWFSYRAIPILRTESDWQNAFDRMKVATNGFYQERKQYWLTPPRMLPEDVRQFLKRQTSLTPRAFALDVRRNAAEYGPVS